MKNRVIGHGKSKGGINNPPLTSCPETPIGQGLKSTENGGLSMKNRFEEQAQSLANQVRGQSEELEKRTVREAKRVEEEATGTQSDESFNNTEFGN